MRISHRHRFIFFSNPKTGSESVRALLDPYSDVQGVPMWEMDGSNPFYSHIRPFETREHFERLGWDFEAYFKFAFVRNPWARLPSLYLMIFARREGRFAEAGRALARLTGRHPSPKGFRRWVRTISVDGEGGGGPPDQRWRVYGTYSAEAYLGDGRGNELVDRVIRLEDIDTELAPTLEEIGLPVADELRIPKRNVHGRRSYGRFYDDATAEYVGRLYETDIRRFGYTFDP